LIKIGLTGPTGAGKSTVAKVLETRGFPCIDADKVAKDGLQDKTVVAALVDAFGSTVVKNGEIDRKRLAQKAFQTKETTALLNSITHPFILQKMNAIALELEQQGVKAVVLDAPLLFEANLNTVCHKTVAVVADRETRLDRIMKRDGLTEELAVLRLNAQPENGFYTQKADIVIQNDGDTARLEAKAQALADKMGRWCE
jgi:dephospho-CoA kinase